MKFPYKELSTIPSNAFPKRRSIFRPIIPVTLKFGDKKIGYEVLLDSGADTNVFHSVIGEVIGIPVDKGKEEGFRGIGGEKLTAYYHDVKVSIGGWEYDLYCGFSADIPTNAHGVLGHIGFFDLFVVKFDTPKHFLEISPKK